MKHYDSIEWTLYKKNLLEDKIYNEMEEHLFQCDECMDTFLSLIDEEEVENAEYFVPEDFAENLMKNIEKITPINQSRKKPTRKKRMFPKDFFLYYTATAAVAIVLTATGVFTTMVDSAPDLTRDISIEETKINKSSIYKLSQRLTEETSDFIYNFNLTKIKEGK